MHSLASADRGTQTDEEETGSTSESPKKKSPDEHTKPEQEETEQVKSVTHQTGQNEEDDANDSDDADDMDDDDGLHSDDSEPPAQIETAIPVVARARVVSVQKPIPPRLPRRNPVRVPVQLPEKGLSDGFDQIPLSSSDRHEGKETTPASNSGRIDAAI